MPNLNIEELERLAAQATPGPWVGRGNHIFCADKKRLAYVEAERALDLQTAAYIVAACNSLPTLIAENRALRERVRELEFREVDYIEERDALLCTKYALERQRELLARNIADVGWCLGCQIAACPNVGSHLDPLLVNRAECKEMIIQWSEKAAKEAGE
jgi:hypothetical protein